MRLLAAVLNSAEFDKNEEPFDGGTVINDGGMDTAKTEEEKESNACSCSLIE